MRAWCVALALAVVLAGCSESASPSDDVDEESFQEFDLEDTEDEFGVIRGVVLDPAINPVAGANVKLIQTGQNVTTNAQGAFGFKNLAAGTYFLEVSKPGFAEVQSSTEVKAGVKEPPALKVLLERLPGTEPSVTPYQYDGFIFCSWFIAIVFATSCLLSIAYSDAGGDRHDEMLVGSPITHYQSELTWEADQELADRLCYRIYTPQGSWFDPADFCGGDPIIRSFNETTVAAKGLTEGGEIEQVVYVDQYVDGVVGFAFQQNFQIFSHAFHNWAPEEDWTFIEHGSPVPPA